jgi:hypothetical protein
MSHELGSKRSTLPSSTRSTVGVRSRTLAMVAAIPASDPDWTSVFLAEVGEMPDGGSASQAATANNRAAAQRRIVEAELGERYEAETVAERDADGVHVRTVLWVRHRPAATEAP